MTKKVLITAALPYANGPLHFGHIAGAYLPADCFARYKRLKGDQVLFICGSDEYGVAITLSAEMAGRTPQEHVDIFHKVNQDFFKDLGISFDFYSRTTWEGHNETTIQFFEDLLKNGHIEARITDQLYSEIDRTFLADRYVVGTCPRCGFKEARGDECTDCGASYEATDLIDPRSKISGAPLVKKPTKHWFLLFDHFKEQLSDWILQKEWKSNVTDFAKHYIENLKPRAITRDSAWGIPVPLKEAEGKVFYVWFDAPIGYISATKHWAKSIGSPEKWKEFWLDPKAEMTQFIGKDNIPFHAVFFPAMIMGQNMPYHLVDYLPANEFYKLEGKQFSKSTGWTIDLESFFSEYSADQIRFAIASNAPESSDSEFGWKDFQNRCNAELLGKYGNLAHRILTFIFQRRDQKVPLVSLISKEGKEFIYQIRALAKEISLSYESYSLRKASAQIMELATLGNTYFDHHKPWALIKDPEKNKELDELLYLSLYHLQVLALVSFPIIPKAATHLWHQLGLEHLSKASWDYVVDQMPESGLILPEPKVIFKRVEEERIDLEIQKLHAKTLTKKTQMTTETVQESPLITYDDFSKITLQVGEITHAKAVEKSQKLLHLQVNFGDHQRSIVSGIAKSYTPEELIGKKAIFVTNLKPTKLMGIESQGMLLSAESGGLLEIPNLQNSPLGSFVR